MIQSNKMLSVLKLEEYIVVLRIFRMEDTTYRAPVVMMLTTNKNENAHSE
jgi:hypothetical protein